MPRVLSPKDVIEFRQRLCDLALKAFAEHGVEGISLRALAAAAGCSRSTPYRYFRNKAEILAAVRQSQFQRMADEAERVAARESDPGKRLQALARHYVQFALATPDAYRAMYSISQREEQRFPDLVKQIERSHKPVTLAVQEAIGNGTMHGDPVNIVHVLWAGLHGIISLHLSDKLHLGRDIDELTEVMIRSLARALSSTPSPEPATARI